MELTKCKRNPCKIIFDYSPIINLLVSRIVSIAIKTSSLSPPPPPVRSANQMGLLLPKFIIIIVFLLCSTTVSDSQKLKTFTSGYGSFNSSDSAALIIQQSAGISGGVLQLTPSTDNPAVVDPANKAGRVLLRQKFKLFLTDIKSNTSRTVASFNSSFLINIYVNNTSKGEGLAFFVGSNPDVPNDSYGEYLGLTNSSTDGNLTNKFVAIEFDTQRQEFDPDDNHLGLNINSVRSNKTVPLSPHSIYLVNGLTRFYNVWVNYDGMNKTLEVYMAEQLDKDGPTPMIPSTPLLKSDLNLQDIVGEDSYFGFSASTGNATQLNCVLRWNLMVEYFSMEEEDPPLSQPPMSSQPPTRRQSLPLKIALGAGIPAVVVVFVAAIWCCWRRKMQKKGSEWMISEGLMRLPGMAREFEYGDLKKATNNFDDKCKLGEGGYGVVYRGVLGKENLEVAVKWFSRESIKGVEDFMAELTIINRLRHKNLVPLLGWCHKNRKLLLVYEYMPNGSLDKHLFHSDDNEPLSWTMRYKIISGLASALHYLHNEFDQRVVHRDLKASNIMLDSDFNTRLGDFGLARAIDNEKTSYAEAEAKGVPGTRGYVAPEYVLTGKASQQSDIYGFGAVLLELVCSQKPGTKIGRYQMLVDWVWSLYREGRVLDAVDEKLRDEFVAEEAERILLLGLACSHLIASERPNTHAIVQIISGLIPVPPVPHFKPAFVWPALGDLSHTSIGDTTAWYTPVTTAFEVDQSSASQSRELFS